MTTQFPEIISYEGARLSLYSEPEIPKKHSRILDFKSHPNPEKLSYPINSALHRKYIGYWAVRSGILYLEKIVGMYQISPGPAIPAKWFTGVLRMVTGHEVYEEQMSFAQYFSSEFYAEVQKGIVTRTWNQFRDNKAQVIEDPAERSIY